MSVDINKIRKGDKLVLAYPFNGYEYHTKMAEDAIKKFGKFPVFTLKSEEIGSWSTSLYFEEIDGSWNSVQFAEFPLQKYRVTKIIPTLYEGFTYAGSETDAIFSARHMADEEYTLALKQPRSEYESFRVESEHEREQAILKRKKSELVDRVLDVLMDEVENREDYVDDLLQMTNDELIRLLFNERVNS